MRVTMHEAHGGGGDAFGDRIECQSTHRGLIKPREQLAIDADALWNLAG
jgi:hypothetical protein